MFFDILLRQHEQKNAKLTLNFLAFPSVKFRETWQSGSKCFTLVGARFSGKCMRPVFFRSGKRHKFAKIEKPACTNLIFFVFKIRILLDAMCCENFGRFHRREFKIITNKAMKR